MTSLNSTPIPNGMTQTQPYSQRRLENHAQKSAQHRANRPVQTPRMETLKTALHHARLRVFDRHSLIQAGKLPYTIIASYDLASVRHYAAQANAAQKQAIPLIIVAPLAITMLVFDLLPQRSLIGSLTAQGFEVYLIDWGTPTRKHTHHDFEYYVLNALPKLIANVQQHNGSSDYSLHGWSMAGVFCLLYAAYFKDAHLRNLIILGSPVDSYASGALGRQFQRFSRLSHWLHARTGWHPLGIPLSLLHSSGQQNALGFKLMDPMGTLKGHLTLLRNLHDRSRVEAHATLGAFLNTMVDYPGGINRDMLLKVWMANRLSQGSFRLGGQTIYLKDIHCALLAGAGRSDGMVTAAAVRPILQLVSSKDSQFVDIPGGHVGLISSEAAAAEFWPVMTNWLAARSQNQPQYPHPAKAS